jgi:hypothetical protein
VALLTKDVLLKASDLVEREVELPSIGGSVRVRSLPAQFSNEAASKALKLISGPRGEQTATIDQAEMELLQVFHGVVEPKFASIEEVRLFAQNTGPAFKKVVGVIDEISGVDKEAIEEANARFQSGDRPKNGEVVGAAASNGGS